VKRSLDISPTNAYAYRNLALVLQAMGQNDRACAAIEDALRLGFSKEYGNEMEELHRRLCR
jgi:tetratricopeptide (TPR) repeat protein